MPRFIPVGLGWQRDLPDPRDYTTDHPEVRKLLAELPVQDSALPADVDLRRDGHGCYLSPPDDQGRLNSSAAFACLGLVEYFYRKSLGEPFQGSPLFLYEMTRRLMGIGDDAGVGIRGTLKTLRRYGVPPEEMRPYAELTTDSLLSDISLLGFSKELESIVYFRLDRPHQPGDVTLAQLKSFLAAGFPVVFGFCVPRSLTQDAVISFRPELDSYRGGQAVLAVGYDDARLPGGQGALLMRNSWGTSWGDEGYGWLPYSFITHFLAVDLWTVVSRTWATSQDFSVPQFVHRCAVV